MNLKEKRSSSSIDSTSSVNSSQSSSVTYHSYFASSTNNSKNSHLMPDNNIDQNDFDDDECSITDFDLKENVNSILNNERKNQSLDESLNGKHSDESEKLNDSTLKENDIRENGEIL